MVVLRTPELVRTSGCCAVCDHRFTDEVVARYPSGAMRDGWAYVEMRHLTPDALTGEADPLHPAAGGGPPEAGSVIE